MQAVAFYMTAKPSAYIKTSWYLQRQLDALLSCHISHFPPGSADAKAVSTYLKLRAYDFGLRCRSRTAEGFRVLGQTQMHCLPEAGK